MSLKLETKAVTTLVNWYVADISQVGSRTMVTVKNLGDDTVRQHVVVAVNQSKAVLRRLKISKGSCITVQGAVVWEGGQERIYARTLALSGEARESLPYQPSVELRDFNFAVVESLKKGEKSISFAAKIKNERYFVYCFDEVAAFAKDLVEGSRVCISAKPSVRVSGQFRQ